MCIWRVIDIEFREMSKKHCLEIFLGLHVEELEASMTLFNAKKILVQKDLLLQCLILWTMDAAKHSIYW